MPLPSLYRCCGEPQKKIRFNSKLLNMGFRTEKQTRSLIGLNIGASTPAEIAVSIAAELSSSPQRTESNKHTQEEETGGKQMRLSKDRDAVGSVLCHDITQLKA